MIVKLLTEHNLELVSLKRACRGSSESTLVKMSKCWKSHATAQLCVSKVSEYDQGMEQEHTADHPRYFFAKSHITLTAI